VRFGTPDALAILEERRESRPHLPGIQDPLARIARHHDETRKPPNVTHGRTQAEIDADAVKNTIKYKNLAVFASSQHWPEGALADAQGLQVSNPDYMITYAPKFYVPVDDGEAGFYAAYGRFYDRRNPWIYGATAVELQVKLSDDKVRMATHPYPWEMPVPRAKSETPNPEGQ
jgi:hypothetical protein